MPEIVNVPTARHGRRKKKRSFASQSTGQQQQSPLPLSSADKKRKAAAAPAPPAKKTRSVLKKSTHRATIATTIQDELDFSPSSPTTPIAGRHHRNGAVLQTRKGKGKDSTTQLRRLKGDNGNDLQDGSDETTSSNDSIPVKAAPTGTSLQAMVAAGADGPSSAAAATTRPSRPLLQSLPSLRRAVAVDTRFLDTKEGRDENEAFQMGVAEFLHATSVRPNLVPVAVAWTAFDRQHFGAQQSQMASSSSPAAPLKTSSAKTKSYGKATRNRRLLPQTSGPKSRRPTEKSSMAVQYESFVHNIDMTPQNAVRRMAHQLLANQTAITPPVNYGNKNRSVVSLPKALMAHATWEYFGDLVDSIVRNNPRTAGNGPLHITILSSDTASLLDTTNATHKSGMDKFWKLVKRFFDSQQLQGIDLVIVQGKIVVANSEEEEDKKDEEEPVQEGPGVDPTTPADEPDGEEPPKAVLAAKDDDSVQDSKANGDKDKIELLSSQRSANIAVLLRSLEGHLRSKADEDFRINRSAIQFDRKLVAQVDISVSIMENNKVCFQRMLHQWALEALTIRIGSVGGSLTQTLRLQLPETSDYDAYSASCQIYYKHIPFRDPNSAYAHGLMVDLELLSRAKLEIKQLVPIESIDASLLFGVPIGLCAGLKGGKDEYHDNAEVIQALFKQLGEQDSALLILSTGPDPEDEPLSSVPHMFHSDFQHFVLLPEVQANQASAPSSTGVLYRLTNSEHIDQETNEVGEVARSEHEPNGFSGYIEASLDSLECASINPLLLNRPSLLARGLCRKLNDSAEQKRVCWTESSVDDVVDATEDQTKIDGAQGHGSKSVSDKKWGTSGTEFVELPDDVSINDEEGSETEKAAQKAVDEALPAEKYLETDELHTKKLGTPSYELHIEKNDTDWSIGVQDTSKSPEKLMMLEDTDDEKNKKDENIDEIQDSDSEGGRRPSLTHFPKLATKRLNGKDDDSEVEWNEDKDDDGKLSKGLANQSKFQKLHTQVQKCKRDSDKEDDASTSSDSMMSLSSTSSTDSDETPKFQYSQ